MERYEKYKPSGIEWIGEIPEHWEALSLKHCVSTKVTDGPHETPEFITEGVPFISVEAIQNGTINFESVRGYISEEEDKRFTLKCKPQKDDIFIVKSGSTTGKIGYVHTSKNFNIWSPLALVRVKETYSSKYFYHFLQSDLFFTQVQLFWSFGTQPNIGMNVLENLKIVVPKAEEQTSIVIYLDCKTAEIDQIIANKLILIGLYEEEKQAVINHAVTHGVNPKVRLKPSGVEWLGDIPDHWEVKKLGHLGKCQNGINISADSFGSGYPFVSYGDVYKNMILPENVAGLVNSTEKDKESYSVKEEDVFFTRTSETSEEIGFASVCMKTIDLATFAGFLIRFRPIPNVLVKTFSKYYFRSKLHRFYFVKEMNLVTRASLSQGLLKNLPVLCPSLEEQTVIAEFLDRESKRLDTQIEKCKKQIELLKEYRTTLISEVVTGKAKVI